MVYVKRVMRVNHYSIHTERVYCDWIKQFIQFTKMTNKQDLIVAAESKVDDFLSYLAIQIKVAASAHNQVMNANDVCFDSLFDHICSSAPASEKE